MQLVLENRNFIRFSLIIEEWMSKCSKTFFSKIWKWRPKANTQSNAYLEAPATCEYLGW